MLVDDQLFAELVSTSAFQRLKSIRFLGGIDYCLIRSPNGIKGNIRYTRYQHSLGVVRLAVGYSEMQALSFSDHRLVYVAALLHDIGHAPLSHSLEPVFAEVFGLEHHRATENVISGREPIGRDIYSILRRHGVDVERVIAIIAGKESWSSRRRSRGLPPISAPPSRRLCISPWFMISPNLFRVPWPACAMPF